MKKKNSNVKNFAKHRWSFFFYILFMASSFNAIENYGWLSAQAVISIILFVISACFSFKYERKVEKTLQSVDELIEEIEKEMFKNNG